jgi:acyl carrier protein
LRLGEIADGDAPTSADDGLNLANLFRRHQAMESLRDQIREVFREVFQDDDLSLTESTTAADVDGWDSLVHINLIIALEKRFGIKFATAEISRLNSASANVGTLFELVGKKLA